MSSSYGERNAQRSRALGSDRGREVRSQVDRRKGQARRPALRERGHHRRSAFMRRTPRRRRILFRGPILGEAAGVGAVVGERGRWAGESPLTGCFGPSLVAVAGDLIDREAGMAGFD